MLYIINLNRGGSYIDSTDCIKNKETVNPINKYDKCFQDTGTVAEVEETGSFLGHIIRSLGLPHF